jgi:hypothetical protein
MALEIKRAAEVVDPELEARWARRREASDAEVLQHVLRAFVDWPGPIDVQDILNAFPERAPEGIQETLATLDQEDLIQMRDDRVDIAYPFSGLPTPFVVELAGGRERYACCAIDALGIAPMRGQRGHIRSHCHHCGEPLELWADPAGPESGAEGLMVWVGQRGEGQRRISTSL